MQVIFCLPGSNLERREGREAASFYGLTAFSLSRAGKGAKNGELDFCCNAINLDWQKHLLLHSPLS